MANDKKTKTVYKIKWRNMSYFAGSVILFLAIIFALYRSFILYKDYSNTKKLIAEIKEKVEITNIVDDNSTSTIKPDSTLSKFDAYWDYIKQSLLDVKMANLKKMNAEAIGYVELKGTEYSYPVAKGTYYKNHSFDKRENSLGWIYVDDDFDESAELPTHTIIYGNKNFLNVLSSTLNRVYKDEWNSNNDNFLIKFYTNKCSTLWQIISVYKTKSKDYLATTFEDDVVFEKYIDKSIKSTEIKFKGYAKTTDKFLTLTTNSNGENIVIQAKLIKIRSEN